METIELRNIKKNSYALTESLRTLKTNIQFCGDDIKTILITSSIPNEGKSTVSFELARSLTESGKNVLLIDTDMRKSVMVSRLGAAVAGKGEINGLSHYLSGQKKLTDILYATPIPKLFMVFAGPYVPNLMTLTDGKMKIFVGNAGFQLIECMDRGAVGAMPGCSMYDVYLDIYNNYVSGNRENALELHNKLLPMLNHIRQNVEQIISFEKRILKRRGIIACDYCRKPSYDTDEYFDRLFDEFYDEMSKRYGW